MKQPEDFTHPLLGLTLWVVVIALGVIAFARFKDVTDAEPTLAEKADAAIAHCDDNDLDCYYVVLGSRDGSIYTCSVRNPVPLWSCARVLNAQAVDQAPARE